VEKATVSSKAIATKKRFVFADVLTILAGIAVVMLHTSLNVFSLVHTKTWAFSLALQAAFIYAVPIFFMLSGMNLLGYRSKYSTKTFFMKRARKTLMALIFGSVAVYLMYVLFPTKFWGAEEFAASAGVADFVKRFLTNNVNSTLWFIYTILYLYLLTPVLSLVVQKKETLLYVMALTLFVSFGLPLLEFLGVRGVYFDQLFRWAAFNSDGLFYYLLGYYVKTYYDELPKFTKNNLVLAVIFLLSSAAMFGWGLIANNFGTPLTPEMTYQSYPITIRNFLCLAQATSLFLFVLNLEPKLQEFSDATKKRISTVSAGVLGVYLFQIPVINFLGLRLGRFPYSLLGNAFVRGIFVFAVTIVVVMAFQWLMRQIKKAQKSSTKNA